jgi:MoaA/NifB/PqqE/SkfB family radical SAM enzyme
MCRIPSTLTVELTKKCQCNCLHCSANYHMNHKEKELTIEQFISAIEESIEFGITTVVLVGGEPLLNKDLDKIISSLDKNKANVVLFTNGEFLTKEKCKKLKASGLDKIFVSLDSYKKEEHNQLRKRNIFDKAIEGIQNAL